MKILLRNLDEVFVSDGRVVPIDTSYRRGLSAFVRRSETIEWMDISERNGRIRSFPPETLSPLMITIRGPTRA